MKNRIIAMLLIVAMIISLAPSTILEVFAAPATQPIISVEDVWAASRSTVEVNVAISGNPGIYGATLTISWAEGLELVDAESGDVFNGLSYQEPSRYVSSGTNFIWYGTRLREIQDGTVLKLTFEVAEDVEESAVLAINVTGDALTDEEDNTVSASYEAGSVRIVNYLPGDTDENDTIDPRDLVALAKYISDNCTTDPDGFNVTINVSAADVNDDGNLDPRDLVLIAKYISDDCKTDPEGFNVILKPASPKCTHNMQATAAKAATCTEDGNIAYWYCVNCSKYFSDAEATNEITYVDTVVSATGHQKVTATPAKDATYDENGNIAYWYCSDCDKYFSDETCETIITYNDTVIPAKSKYGITYYLYDNIDYLEAEGVENPNPAWYDPKVGLTLENPEKPGFTFDGWYDAEGASGELVKTIEPGETGNKKFYARWSLVSYSISYKDETYNVNYVEDTYTVDKRKVLLKPEQKGLNFVGWEDSKGVFYDSEIPKGTTGNLELTAKWKSHLYVAKPSKEAQELDCFYHDPSQDMYYFVQELGYLDGIPLETLTLGSNAVRHNGGIETSLSQSETITIEKAKAEEIGNAISTSVYKSEEFSTATTNANEHSAETHFNVSAEVGVDAIIVAKIGAELGSSGTDTSSFEETTLKGGTYQDGSEEVHEHSATISYLTQSSITITETKTIPADSPAGYYAFARLGTAKVYGIVAFNGKTGNYTLTTYSVLYAAYNSDLFFPDEDWPFGWTNPDIETLPFNMDINKISDYVNNYIYVDYDGNGGTYTWDFADSALPDVETVEVNKMPVDEFAVDAALKLSANKYERVGYKFVGWSLTKDGEKIFDDEAEITAKNFSFEESEKAKRVTLYAVWEPIVYDITYHTNGGTLPEEYPTTYTVKTIEGINLPTLTHDAGTDNYLVSWYLDEACTRLYDEHKISYITAPQNIDLYAKWYDSIDSTPNAISGNAVIDWRNETDTDILNHLDYSNLKITNSTEEITFIGDPEKTYTNFRMSICGFAEGQKLVIRFVDFNFLTNDSTAIGLDENVDVNLTIDVIGSCSIGTNYAGGSIIGSADAAIKNLTFTDSGTMSVIAGDGATVTAAGMSGNDGGVAVYAKNIVFDMDSDAKLHIYGGNGSDGVRGADGADGTTNNSTTFEYKVWNGAGTEIQSINRYNKAYAGSKGATGGNGGNGGLPVVCETLIANTPGLTLIYGNGGDGGAGGSGGDGGRGHDYSGSNTGFSYLTCFKPGEGGDAGDGGDGGNAGHSVTLVYTFDNVDIITGVDGLAGGGGTPGLKGIGGNGGSTSALFNDYSTGKAADGLPGDPGMPGKS